MPSRTSPHGRRSSSPSARRKALSGRTREGPACVAIGGLWNWQIRGRTIADLDRIDWYEREAVIVPDSDIWTRPDLLQPVFALGKELEGRPASTTTSARIRSKRSTRCRA